MPGQVAHGQFVDQKVLAKYDAMSVQDRLDECKKLGLMTDLEMKCFVPWITRKYGASPAVSGLLGQSRLFCALCARAR